MNPSDDEASHLEQQANALFRQSSVISKKCSALAQESTRLNDEAVRLFEAAKTAGFMSKGKLNARAKSCSAEGRRLYEECLKLQEEGRTLLPDGKKLLEESQRLRSQVVVSQPSLNYVTCRCQNCDTGIEFDANQLAEENSTIPCPHCGLETKLFLPPI